MLIRVLETGEFIDRPDVGLKVVVSGRCKRNEMIRLEDITKNLGETFRHRKVCLELKDVPQHVALPRSWENFGLRPRLAPVFPDGWNSFSNEFPSIIALLNDCLLGTVLLLGDEIELAYIFHDGNSLYYYVGGRPVEGGTTETFEFKHLPSRLQDFYREVHDGYTFFPARSMGPQRLGDQSRVSELVDEADDSLAAGWITVFSSGGGDYVAVNADSHGDSDGLIWWHENPATPEHDIDVFRVMDAWMGIFLEDTKPREPRAKSGAR